jgi:hypothetical protein
MIVCTRAVTFCRRTISCSGRGPGVNRPTRRLLGPFAGVATGARAIRRTVSNRVTAHRFLWSCAAAATVVVRRRLAPSLSGSVRVWIIIISFYRTRVHAGRSWCTSKTRTRPIRLVTKPRTYRAKHGYLYKYVYARAPTTLCVYNIGRTYKDSCCVLIRPT